MDTIKYLNKIPCTIFGFTGPVSAGKTVCTYNLSKKWTTQHSDEKKRNMSRKSGYAGVKIFRDNNGKLYSSDSSVENFSLKENINKSLNKILKKLKKNVKNINIILKRMNKDKIKLKKFSSEDTKSLYNFILTENNKLIEIMTKLTTEKINEELVESIDDYYLNSEKIKNDLEKENELLNLKFELINHYSIIDCPGHYEVMNTMLNNVDIMRNTIVILSAALSIEKQPQLKQHLAAIKLANITNIIVCINKVDLVNKDDLMNVKYDLDNLLKSLDITPKIIIPTAFKRKIGHQYLLQSIVTYFTNDFNSIKSNNLPIKGQISRSFDINKSNKSYLNLKGGVIGGSILKGGPLKIGDKIEIRPGIFIKKKKGSCCKPIITTVQSIKTEKNIIDQAYPGCLIGIGTILDPFYCKDDQLVGNIFGFKGNMPDIYYPDITLKLYISPELGEWKIKKNDIINLQIGTSSFNKTELIKIVKNTKSEKIAVFKLPKPCCIDDKSNIIIRKLSSDGIKKIIGKADFIKGETIKII